MSPFCHHPYLTSRIRLEHASVQRLSLQTNEALGKGASLANLVNYQYNFGASIH